MKKTYILTVMLLVLTVILGGCGSQDSDQASSGSFELSVEDTDTQGSSSGPEAPQVQETAIEVFVPSSMTLSMNDLIEAYKEQSGAGRIVANYSDSASLGDQIRNNANCDIFICDDPAILDQLTEEKLADAESRAAFSGRELVLVTTKGEVTKESQSFYEFLLSEKAAEIMSASFDSGSAQ